MQNPYPYLRNIRNGNTQKWKIKENCYMKKLAIQQYYSSNICYFNPFMPLSAKSDRQFWWYLSNRSNIWKIFEGELFIRNLSTISASNILRIHTSFQSYFQKYDSFRRHSSGRSPGMQELSRCCIYTLKRPNLYSVGTHLRVLSDGYLMNTNMTGDCFQNS